PGVAELTHKLESEFNRFQLPVLVEADTAALAGMKSGYSVADLGREADLLVVLGGDGTILHVVGQLEDVIKPIFGINVGSLGFLTCANSATYADAVECIAGGPILAPESGAFVITPICPHVLTNRSIIVGEDSIIGIEVSERAYPVFLTVDGREPLRIEVGAIVEMKKSRRVLPLASLPGVSFFGVVRQKLKWSGSNI